LILFADQYSGNLCETDEAEPFWCDINELPYDNMWADDALWIPLALEGKEFDGQFIFDGENMISHNIIEKENS